MFHTNHFRNQLFHLNKCINGKVFLSNWQRLYTIYGRQFSAIRNRNGRSCIIQSKHQEFCQCNQFCTSNDNGINSLPVKKANSPSTFSPPKMPTKNVIKKNEKYLEGMEKLADNQGDLEIQFLGLDIYNEKKLRLELQKGRSGQKSFNIALKKPDGLYSNFPKILVPQDAYSFVRALDELIVELAAENFEQKFNIKEVDNEHQHKTTIKLKTVELIGQHHKFKLELVLYINMYNAEEEIRKEICLRLCALNKIRSNDERVYTFPLKSLPWLRKQMSEMLVRHDGTVAISLEAPAQIPKQFFPKDVFHTLPASNGISPGYQKRMQSQLFDKNLVNKKTTIFQQYPRMANINQNSNQSGIKNQRMFRPLATQQKQTLKQSAEVRKPVEISKIAQQLDPKMAALERGIQTLFDFDEEEMEKYRRISAKINNPTAEH